MSFMTEQPQWIPYNELDLLDPENNVFNIDTRDFHAGYFLSEDHKDIDILKIYPDFFHTKEEVNVLLDRYFNESGGDIEWRMLCLGDDLSWDMKYIRIWRTEFGFIICDSYNKAKRKGYLSQEVNKKYL